MTSLELPAEDDRGGSVLTCTILAGANGSGYDNSGSRPRLVLGIAGGKVTQSRLLPAHASHVHIADAVARALGVPAVGLLGDSP